MNANTSAVQPDEQSDTRRGIARWLIREVMGVLLVVATLFIPAGAAWIGGRGGP